MSSAYTGQPPPDYAKPLPLGKPPFTAPFAWMKDRLEVAIPTGKLKHFKSIKQDIDMHSYLCVTQWISKPSPVRWHLLYGILGITWEVRNLGGEFVNNKWEGYDMHILVKPYVYRRPGVTQQAFEKQAGMDKIFRVTRSNGRLKDPDAINGEKTLWEWFIGEYSNQLVSIRGDG